MPIIKSAIKRMRQSAKARTRNAAFKRNLKASVKGFIAEISPKNLQKAQSEIDKAVKKHLLNKNTAARQKAALHRAAKAASAKAAPAKAAAKPVAKAAAKAVAKKPTAKKAAPKKTKK